MKFNVIAVSVTAMYRETKRIRQFIADVKCCSMNRPMKTFVGKARDKDAYPKHYFWYLHCFAIELLLIVLFSNTFHNIK